MQSDSRQDLAISLFPFLSILSCVIGVLVLIVTVMSIGHVAGDPDEELVDENATAYVELEFAIDEMLVARTETEALIAEAEAVSRRVQELKEELAKLEANSSAPSEEERQVIAELQQRDNLTRENDALRAKYRELMALVESKGKRLESLPAQHSVRIVGSSKLADGAFGLEARKKTNPIFVECAGDTLIVHPDGSKIKKNSIKNGRAFAAVVERAKSNDGAIVIFLIRENGVKLFDVAKATIKEKKVRYGFLPIPGSGQIDLSQFTG